MEHIVLVPVVLAVAMPEDDGYNDAYVADAVNELLRENQRSFTPGSALLDYSIDIGHLTAGNKKTLADGEVYVEGSAL